MECVQGSRKYSTVAAERFGLRAHPLDEGGTIVGIAHHAYLPASVAAGIANACRMFAAACQRVSDASRSPSGQYQGSGFRTSFSVEEHPVWSRSVLSSDRA